MLAKDRKDWTHFSLREDGAGLCLFCICVCLCRIHVYVKNNLAFCICVCLHRIYVYVKKQSCLCSSSFFLSVSPYLCDMYMSTYHPYLDMLHEALVTFKISVFIYIYHSLPDRLSLQPLQLIRYKWSVCCLKGSSVQPL